MIPLWSGFAYKQHQEIAIEWMQEREKDFPAGGLLCDEMGLGKTIEMLGLIKAHPKSHSLILAPVAVLNQWADTARHAGISVMRPVEHTWTLEGSFRFGAPKLYIIGYEAARTKPSLLSERAWDRIICDEAHRLASGNSYYDLVDCIYAKSRWLLSATPIVNGMDDLSNLFNLIGVEDAKIVVGDYDLLAAAAGKYILARTMNQLREAGMEAPPAPIIKTRSLPFDTDEEAEFYKGMSGIIVRKWKALDSDGAGALAKLQLFMKLRQLSLHPQVYIDARRARAKLNGTKYEREDWVGTSTKFEAIRSTIESQIGGEVKHKWIVFCHFHPEMALLQSMLKAQQWCRSVQIYSGELNAKERAETLKTTHIPLPSSKQTDIILVQLQSGGTGLNLQHFDRIIFTGPWWTSALMDQAIGRAVRMGQKEVVEVYNFVLKEEEAMNIDKLMKDKANEKGLLCREVLELASRAFTMEKEDEAQTKELYDL
jgi:SNF2 family DNA or RNA helicase